MAGYVAQQIRVKQSWGAAVRAVMAARGGSSAGKFAKYREDPIGFARDCFGIEAWEAPAGSVRSSQANLLRAMVTHTHVACRSGHKVGKTTTAAIIAWWWLLCVCGTVVVTASGFTQLKKQVWKEIKRLSREARNRGHDFPVAPLDPQTGIDMGDGRIMVGVSVAETENMGGYSHPRMLTIADEASGIAEDVFEAIEGNTAGGSDNDPDAIAKQLLLGNPTQVSGQFYKCFTAERETWSCHHISSEDTPNAVSGESLVRGLATKAWVEKRREVWGRESVKYAVRCAGDFPSGALTTVNSLADVEAAAARWAHATDDGWLEVGVDVATHGDDESVFIGRRGLHVYRPRAHSGCREDEVAAHVIAYVWDFHRRGNERVSVKVDTCGVGAAVAALLETAAHDHDIMNALVEAIGRGDIAAKAYEDFTWNTVWVNAAEKSDTPDDFLNLRSQLWFAGRDFLRQGGTIPPHERTKADLLAPNYAIDVRGRLVVEPKKVTKKKLKASPDYGDAFNLCVYSPTAIPEHDDQDDYAGSDGRWGDDARGY